MSLSDFIASNVPFNVPYHLTHYVPGETPLSTNKSVATALVSYLAIVFGLRELMKTRKPLKLQALFQIHNVNLTLGSGLLLALMAEELLPIWMKSGTFIAACDESSWTTKLEFYYMINYYFKYLELLDTVFLVLKKKPLAFLHVYHHAVTAFLCYTQLNGKTSISWVVIMLNLTVHVLMYYYYYATAGGAKIWWKKYLTTLQITQFVIDLFAVYFGTYSHYVYTYWPNAGLPLIGNCSGSETAAVLGCAVLTSYLGLFVEFYLKTYKKPARGKKVANGVANGTANGHANGHANGNSNGNGKANGSAKKS